MTALRRRSLALPKFLYRHIHHYHHSFYLPTPSIALPNGLMSPPQFRVPLVSSAFRYKTSHIENLYSLGGDLRMPWTELYSAKSHIRRNWKQHLISNNASRTLLFPDWRGDVTRTVIVRAQNGRVTLSCRGSKHRNTLQPLNSRFIFFSFLYKYPVQIISISSSSSLIPSHRTLRWCLFHFWSTWRGTKKFYNTQWLTSVGS